MSAVNPSADGAMTGVLAGKDWPDLEWDAADRPLIIANGAVHRIEDLTAPLEVRAAYVVGVNQRSFERLTQFLRSTEVSFYEMRVADVSGLERIGPLRHLSIRWNTKLEALSSLACLDGLETLVLEDVPKVNDLAPLTALRQLRGLSYSGGLWNKNRAQSLAPLAELPRLTELHLTNLIVKDGGLRPLVACGALRRLVVSNQFDTSDYALLSVRLPNVQCDMFAPYVPAVLPTGEDIMVVGKRKPFLRSSQDAARLERYIVQWDAMVAAFVAEGAGE